MTVQEAPRRGRTRKLRIIDGQQRLLTVSVYLRALQIQALALGLHADAAALDEHLWAADGPRILPSAPDRAGYEALLQADLLQDPPAAPREENDIDERVALRTALGLFLHALSVEAATPADWRRLRDIALDDTIFGVFELEENADAYSIFERLNNLGRPLSKLDVIKTVLMQRAERLGVSEAVLERENAIAWAPFDAHANMNFWSRATKRHLGVASNVEWCLRAYLVARQRRTFRLQAIQQIASRLIAETPDPLGTLREIGRAGAAYLEIARGPIDPTDRSPLEPALATLRGVENAPAQPLLMAILLRFGDDVVAARRLIELIENCMVRRFFLKNPAGNPHEVFAKHCDVVDPARGADIDETVALLTDRLSAEANGAFWPDDAAFRLGIEQKTMVAHGNSNEDRKRRVLLGIFARLNAAATGDPHGATPLPPEPTIEHIWPINGGEKWPGPSPQEALKTLGNLTVVSCALNQRLANDDWSRKRRLIAEHCDAPLDLELAETPIWNADAIAARASRLADLALSIWPRA